MTTFRCIVVFDYVAPNGTDPDEFHDWLREFLDGGADLNFTAYDENDNEVSFTCDTVRDIDVTELED